MKFQPRSESTRQFIIETAADLFNQKGYAGTAMSDITAATGLTKGSIYGNFENKDEMALATFDYIADMRRKKITAFAGQGKNYTEKLFRHALVITRNRELVFPNGGCPLLNAGMEADDTNEALRQRVATEFVAWRDELTEIITLGIEAGEFNKDTNANETAVAMMALIEGGIALSQSIKDPSCYKSILNTIEKMIQAIVLSV
jgi:TetR/AcrR family transcriptional repressor of nem operon